VEGIRGGKGYWRKIKTHPDGHFVKGIVNWLAHKAISVEPAPSTILRRITKQKKQKKKKQQSDYFSKKVDFCSFCLACWIHHETKCIKCFFLFLFNLNFLYFNRQTRFSVTPLIIWKMREWRKPTYHPPLWSWWVRIQGIQGELR
jgi:hypothetical protein